MLMVMLSTLGMATGAFEPDWPEAWRAAWADPPAELRPLQIVHGIPPEQATPERSLINTCQVSMDRVSAHEVRHVLPAEVLLSTCSAPTRS